MNGLPYYKAYPRDFIEGTIGLPFELKGAYRLVLDLIYMQGGNLPNDDRYISGLLGCSIRKWASLRDDLIARGKIYVNGEFLRNYRADNELETLAKLQEKQSENRSRPNKIKDIQSPPSNHTEPEPDTEEREPKVSLSAREVRPSEFDAFWMVYPRKVGKDAARKAWLSARKKAGVEEIVGGLRGFVAATTGAEQRFIPHPSTWLNEGRWQDEQSHARNGPRSSTEDLNGLATISAADDVARLWAPIQRKAIGQ